MSKLFYVPADNITGNRIIIKDKEAHHIKNVLRFKEKNRITTFDENGREYAGIIEKILPKQIIVKIISSKQQPSYKLPPITLAIAIPKKQKMDYIIEKCTELGAKTIMPMITKRTLPAADNKYLRWTKIAQQTSKQCSRVIPINIGKPSDFKEILNNVKDYEIALILHLGSDRLSLNEAIKNWQAGPLLVLIGPEGDFTPEEIDLAEKAGCISVDLGPLILKVDTAALAVLSILNYEFRNKGARSSTG